MFKATGSPLTVVNPLQFSVLQLPLSLTALGLYIRDSQCSPFAMHSQTSPPQPFCSAPIVLAAVIVLVEVCVRARTVLEIFSNLPLDATLQRPLCFLLQRFLLMKVALLELAMPSLQSR